MAKRPEFLILPAAGLGTRMKSVERELPKELLPLGNKPAIQYAIDEALDAGIEHIVVILNRAKHDLERYIEKQEIRCTLLYQEKPTGESDAIALAEPIVGQRAMAVVYPDNIYLPAPGALGTLTRVFIERKADVVALSVVTHDNQTAIGNAGKVDVESLDRDIYRIRELLPKGPGHFCRRFDYELRTCGMMMAGPHLFDAIRRARATLTHGEFTDEPVRRLLLQERGLLGVRLPGEVFDIGNPQGYRRCQNASGSTPSPSGR